MLHKCKYQKTRKRGGAGTREEGKEEEELAEQKWQVTYLAPAPQLLSVLLLFYSIPVSIPWGGEGHFLWTPWKSHMNFWRECAPGVYSAFRRRSHCLILLRIEITHLISSGRLRGSAPIKTSQVWIREKIPGVSEWLPSFCNYSSGSLCGLNLIFIVHFRCLFLCFGVFLLTPALTFKIRYLHYI